MQSKTSSQGTGPYGRLVRNTINSAVYPAIAFVAAFRLDWDRGWINAAVFIGASLAGTLIVTLTNPEVLAARARNTKEQRQPFDKLFYTMFVPLILVYPAVGGLDGGRFEWAPLPFWTVYWGAALFFAGSVITTWTLVVNRHAERIYRVQEERGHAVITDGPYRFVRHPMYLGSIIGFPSTALMLGSGWALVPMALLIVIFVWRTGHEDIALHSELPGYADFAGRTRYRLLPGIW